MPCYLRPISIPYGKPLTYKAGNSRSPTDRSILIWEIVLSYMFTGFVSSGACPSSLCTSFLVIVLLENEWEMSQPAPDMESGIPLHLISIIQRYVSYDLYFNQSSYSVTTKKSSCSMNMMMYMMVEHMAIINPIYTYDSLPSFNWPRVPARDWPRN